MSHRTVLRPPDEALPVPVLRLVILALACTLLPTFLIGALAAPLGADLGVGTGTIGAAVSAFFITASTLSVVGGRIVDRFGDALGFRVGLVGVALATAGIGFLASTGVHLFLGFLLIGASLTLVDAAIARSIAFGVGWRRQGLAFGLKESSVPTASMLAGVSLPLLGATLGWQIPFRIVAVLALLVAASVPREPRVPPAGTTGTPAGAEHGAGEAGGGVDGEVAATTTAVDTSPLTLLAVASGIGGGVAAAVVTFLVPTALMVGLGATAAGLVLAGASVISILVRLAVGVAADRHPRRLMEMIVVGLGCGLVGTTALALAAWGRAPTAQVGELVAPVADPGTLSVTLLVVGAVLLVGPGWGWTGLVFLTAVRLLPDHPARASSRILMGLAGGGAVMPLAAGWGAERFGFGWTWGVASALMALAVALSITVRARERATLR